MPAKVLILLPNAYDRVEAKKINPHKYETHLLHASDEVKDKKMTSLAYGEYLGKSGFLNSYIDRAVQYVKEHEITGIMYGHDLSSVIASVVCERTGLRGPSLDSTFISLHKYYSRKTNPSNMWFEYINLDDLEESWKPKIRYPCFVKPPFLTWAKGCCAVKNEEELRVALQRLRSISLSFVTGYAEFFFKYLDLKKFPLAVQNIAIVEELIECRDQYFVESWVDENGVCSPYTTSTECFCNQKEDVITGYVVPQFTLKQPDNAAMIRTAEQVAIRIGLRNTFFNVELWKIGDEFKVVEINSRCVSPSSAMYTRMYDLSNYEAAISLACGEKESIPKKPASTMYQVGEEITGNFYVLTYEEGKAKDLMDFDYAKKGSKADGAYNNEGAGVDLTVAEDTIVMKSTTRGSMLCTFMITANSPSELFDNMRKVRKKLLLRNDHPDLYIIEPKWN